MQQKKLRRITQRAEKKVEERSVSLFGARVERNVLKEEEERWDKKYD